MPLVFKMYLPSEKHAGTHTFALLLSNCRHLDLSTRFLSFSPSPLFASKLFHLKTKPFHRVCLTAQSTWKEIGAKNPFLSYPIVCFPAFQVWDF